MHDDTNRTNVRVARGVATVVLAGAALAPAWPWNASAAAEKSDRKLDAAYEQQPATIGTPVCSPTTCVVTFSLSGVIAGDVAGSFVQAGAGARMPDGALYATSTLVFTGTVAGCGSGTFTMRSTGLNRAGVTSGELEIVEGSGTDDLASLTGTGTLVAGEVDPATGIGTGRIEYRVKC